MTWRSDGGRRWAGLALSGMWLGVVAGLLAPGCGPEPSADPLAYLRVGLDPRHEARAVRGSFERAGYRLVARICRDELCALGFERKDGATAVRVLTRDGIALGLDAPDPRVPERARVWIVRGKAAGTDLDGDDHREIPVAVALPGRPEPCIGLVRIVDGDAHEVGLAPGPVPDGSCVESLRDVGGDGRPEALVVVRRPDLATAPGQPPPTVPLPLAGRRGRWQPATSSAYAGFWVAQRDRRRQLLAQARAAGRVPEALRLAVELAALSHLWAVPGRDPVRVFDAALSGLVLPSAVVSTVDCIRGVIAAGWPAAEPPCYTPGPHGP